MIRIPGRAAVAVLGLVLVAGACGSSSSSSSKPTTTVAPTTTTTAGPQTSASAALCSARDALQKSVQDLTNVDVVKNGTSSLQTALDNVKTNLEAVKSAASSDLQPQVKALQDSLSQLQTAVSNVGSGGGLAAIVTAAQDVARNGSTLFSSLQNLRCS